MTHNTLNEVKKILSESDQGDWIVDDESGMFTYKEDLNLHIERSDDYESFSEPWANQHPNPSAKKVTYIVKYGASFVERRFLVSVDGHQATLPMPESTDDLRVKASKVNFAKIVNIGDGVDEYLERSKIRVEG